MARSNALGPSGGSEWRVCSARMTSSICSSFSPSCRQPATWISAPGGSHRDGSRPFRPTPAAAMTRSRRRLSSTAGGNRSGGGTTSGGGGSSIGGAVSRAPPSSLLGFSKGSAERRFRFSCTSVPVLSLNRSRVPVLPFRFSGWAVPVFSASSAVAAGVRRMTRNRLRCPRPRQTSTSIHPAASRRRTTFRTPRSLMPQRVAMSAMDGSQIPVAACARSARARSTNRSDRPAGPWAKT